MDMEAYIVANKWLVLCLSFFTIIYAQMEEGEEDDFWKQIEEEEAFRAQYGKYIDQITKEFSEQVFNQFDLSGGVLSCNGRKKIESISVRFAAHRRASLEEARALALSLMDSLKKKINGCGPLRTYLAEYPFIRMSIDLSFECFLDRWSADGTIAKAYINKNELTYKTYDPFTERFEPLLTESYEEAIQLHNDSPVKNPAVHMLTDQEKALDAILPAFVEQMHHQYDISIWSIGGKMTGGVTEVGVHWVAMRRATQKEARELLVGVVETLLKTLNESERLRLFLKPFPFPANRVKMAIRFVNENFYPYFDNSVKAITIENGQISYTVDENYPSIPSESYAEALKTVETRR